ncbi:MAG: hypothetical protein HY329_00970 [Chloroflexi bacterium]|nr:hypothetical protein [Chloroflexota bacterium]
MFKLHRIALILALALLSVSLVPLLLARSVAAENTAVQQAAAAGDRVYTANEDSNTISVINPATLSVESTIVLGEETHHRPLYNGHIDVHGLLASPDGRWLAATARGSSTAVLVDRAAQAVRGYALVGREPHVGTFTPDGRELWVTVRGERFVAVVNPETLEVTERIPTVSGPSMVWFTRDLGPGGDAFLSRQLAFVGSQKEPRLQVFNASSRSLLKTLAMPGAFSPFLIASPEGDEVWITHKTTDNVSVIDVRTLEIRHTFPVGRRPNHVAIVGDRAYVTIAMDNTVEVYRRAGSSLPQKIATIPMGTEPHGIWPNGDASRLYVGHERSNDVWVLNTADHAIVGKVPVGKKPIDVVYVPTVEP